MQDTSASRALANEEGAQMVEFALTVGMFLLLLFFMLDLFQFGFRLFSAQFIAERAARDLIVGDATVASGTCSNVRVTTARNRALARADAFGLDLTAGSIKVCPLSNATCTGGADGGKPGQFVVVTVTVPLHLFLFPNAAQIGGLAIGRNERFLDC